jgi:hypothetical protein
MGFLAANVHKTHGQKIFIIIIIALSIISFKTQAQNRKDDISKFVMKNFRVPREALNNCKWNYLVLEITLNETNKIKYKEISKSDLALLNSLDFLKTYSVSKLDISSFPVLLVISIQDNVGLCDNEYAKIPAPSDVLQQILPLISQSVKDYPKIRILDPIIANIEASRQ